MAVQIILGVVFVLLALGGSGAGFFYSGSNVLPAPVCVCVFLFSGESVFRCSHSPGLETMGSGSAASCIAQR